MDAVIGATALRGQIFKHHFPVPGFVESGVTQQASGIYVVDLKTGNVAHALVMFGVKGIYDIGAVAGIARPFLPKLGGTDEDPQWTTFSPDLSVEP